MNATSIEWTNFSSQLIQYKDESGKDVWACAKHSPGCAHCYSEAIANRYRRGGPFTAAQGRNVKPYFSDAEAQKILRSKKLAGQRVFVGDMTDVFGEWVPDELLDRMFAVFALRPDVTFQVLTKRADRMSEYMTHWPNGMGRGHHIALRMNERGDGLATIPPTHHPNGSFSDGTGPTVNLPMPNVWLGVSVEDQQRADERIPLLLQTPAAVRFVSCEPLLGSVDMREFIVSKRGYFGNVPELECCGQVYKKRNGVDWVIVGGESGHGARPCNIAWIRSIVKQCKAAGVPCFVKQLGSRIELSNDSFSEWPNSGDGLIDLEPDRRVRFQGEDMLVRLESAKGGDVAEWPEDLRIREWPQKCDI